MSKKSTVPIHESVDLVKSLTPAQGKALFVHKIKTRPVEVRLDVTSEQAEIRAAEVREVGAKQLHAGLQILKGFVVPGLAAIEAARDEKARAVLVKDLAARIEKVNKGTADAYEKAMQGHWKKIERAELEAEKAVARAEADAKEQARKAPHLGASGWFKLLVGGLNLRSAIVASLHDFQKTRTAVALAVNAFQTEALRKQSEAGRGTPPAVVRQQREILVEGYARQFKTHALELTKHGRLAIDRIEKILDVTAKIDKAAAAAHAEVRELQFALERVDKALVQARPLLDGAAPMLTKAMQAAVAHLVDGKVEPKEVFHDVLARLEKDASFKLIQDGIEQVAREAGVIARL